MSNLIVSIRRAIAKAIDTLTTTLKGSGGTAMVGFMQSGTGAVLRTVEDELKDRISVKQFGAKCDGVTDDTAAIQKAIDYCATFTRWPNLVIPGRCKLLSPLKINRPVDNTLTEFRICGEGEGAGFYTAGNVTMFDSDLPMTGVAPVSEFVTFENIAFETSSFFNESFVLSKKFLRIKFKNCYFWLLRCVVSDTYVQTFHFNGCNIRNNKSNFINCKGLYDVSFNQCVIENGQTIIRSIDENRGAAGLRFVDCVIEGISQSVVVTSGASGFDLIGCHLESNFSPEFNLFAGGPVNGSVTVIGNYIYNPNGITFYFGPTAKVFSAGNTVFPNILHSNAIQVTDLVSCGDNCIGGISDAVNNAVVNGVYRAGNSQDEWKHSEKHFTKSVAGEFGFGANPIAGVRGVFWGQDQSQTKYAAVMFDSVGNTIAGFRNDRKVTFPNLQNYANDAAAAAAGIPVGYLYRNGSAVQVRAA